MKRQSVTLVDWSFSRYWYRGVSRGLRNLCVGSWIFLAEGWIVAAAMEFSPDSWEDVQETLIDLKVRRWRSDLIDRAEACVAEPASIDVSNWR
jgi:hypothetical protein